MPLSRRAENPKPESLEPAILRLKDVPVGPKYPRRVTVFGLLRDESGSMSTWRDKQGSFIPGLRHAITDAGGPKVGDLVYVLYGIVSGGVTFSPVAPLSSAKDPEFKPDGYTPLGQGLKNLAERLDGFVTEELIPNEVTVRDVKLAIVSDLHPSEEDEVETEAGVERFLEVVKKYRADVQLVGPSEQYMNQPLAKRLDVKGHGVMYLDSADPKAVFKWTFDSILAQSRKLGGSRPRKK